MKLKCFFLFLCTVFLFTACGNDGNGDNGVNPGYGSVKRVYDGDNIVFLAGGIYTTINNHITAYTIDSAFANTTWVRTQYFLYDNNWISGNLADYKDVGSNGVTALLADSTAAYGNIPSFSKFTIARNVLTIPANPISSTYSPVPDTYEIVAIRLTAGDKLMVMDKKELNNQVPNIDGFNRNTTVMRTVWRAD